MEFLSPFQLLILVLIVVALIVQIIAFKKGKFVEVDYSSNQRLSIAISVAAPLIFGAVFTTHYFLIAFGIAIGAACYQRKKWYKFK
ncbi:hypothetical protein AVL56_02605 [Alteromonas stellipolaris]|uniref:hypothetical protein n=1 Tax=Alteromonas stellipolaris TaxID=233316 RepID=UPI00076FE1D5|nr:hypothetical protein [Alteromonas stellipolaris]AMJ93301.1 hypothetical protein AVL56_02605 [Alteromonas stellipolaris]